MSPDSFIKELQTAAAELAKKSGPHVKEAQADCQAFLDTMKADLQVWGKQLAEGKMSKDDFAFLLGGKKSLAAMNALTRVGLAAGQVDRLRVALLDLVLSTAARIRG